MATLAAMATITALNVYPIKSCKGIALQSATVFDTGIEHDRQWLIVKPNGQFVTQREIPRLALISTALTSTHLQISSPDAGTLNIPLTAEGPSTEVTVWKDRCAAFDMGDEAAHWLETHTGKPHRLVKFDPSKKRPSSAQWTQGVEALNQFSDGFPFLVISEASLADLNSRLAAPLPMNRFRPNIVVDGIAPYAEDDVHDFRINGVTLRGVKPCTRCAITTTNQVTAEREGDEPLRTLRGYRFSPELKGVLFGQNAILIDGAGKTLQVGQQVEVEFSSNPQ